MVIEHLSKDTEDSGLVFVDGAFNVDVEQDGLGFTTSRFVNQHEGCRIILKLLAEHFNGSGCSHRLVFKNVGQHLQKVRFTTSKEAGNPHADIICWLVKAITVIVEKADEVLLQFSGNHILTDFLLDHICRILIDFDDTVNWSVDVLSKHVMNLHGSVLLR